jgi:hypothetical protein
MVRSTMKPSFEVPTPRPTNIELGNNIQSRIGRLPLPDKFQNVSVSVVGRTAVLTGQVNSMADARFIERLVSLEVGIDSVENRLQVPTEATESVPAGSNP